MRMLIFALLVSIIILANTFPASALEQTLTGYYYPIGEKNYDSDKGYWLSRPPEYFAGLYHNGIDMMTRTENENNENSHVYAIAAGEVILVSYNSEAWGPGNAAVHIKHKTADGIDFVSVYGHIRPRSEIGKGAPVTAGQYIGYTGPWMGTGTEHLHFGISKGKDYQKTKDGEYGWGRVAYTQEYWDATDEITGEKPFTNGFIEPVNFIESHSPESCESKKVVSQLNYIWTPGPFGNTCEMGTAHYRVEEGPVQCIATKVTVFEACAAIRARCQVSSLGSDTDSWIVSFVQSILGRKALAASDYPDADFQTLCNETVTHANVCSIGDSVQSVFGRNGGQFVSYPTIQTTGQLKPDPLPNLQVQHFYVYDSNGTLLNENTSYMNVGNKYDIHTWVVSQGADAEVGAKPGTENIETDVFYKIALSEPTAHWKHLGRVYTRPSSLPKDDGHKEVLSFTVPPEAAGQRIYFRAKMDSTGEVNETNEHDNWSDIEWYPVPGSCDLTVSYVRLTGGRTFLKEGDHYGFETAIKNFGPNSCPMDIRSAYYHKKPGSSTWDYVTDDGTPASKLLPNQENPELTLNEPLVADTPGIHEVMVCTDHLNSNQEINESNNCTTASFELRMYRPDLVITQVGLTHNRTSLIQGDRFGLSTVVQNQGNAPATVDTRSAYYLMPPGTSSWIYQTDDLTTAVQMCVGCSKTEWNTTDPYVANAVGWWQGLTCADKWNWQSEFNETNNCRSFAFYVAPAGPDLVVSALGIPEGTSIRSGTYIHPWCTVKNVGNRTPAADSRLAYYIDGVYRTDDFVGASQVNPGQEKWEQVQSKIIKLGNRGTRTYTCCADFRGNVLELNESNNCASMTLVVR